MSEADKLRVCQRRWDNLSDEPPKPKRRTMAEQDVEGASRRVCRCCGQWKMMGDFDHVCQDCNDEFMETL